MHLKEREREGGWGENKKEKERKDTGERGEMEMQEQQKETLCWQSGTPHLSPRALPGLGPKLGS